MGSGSALCQSVGRAANQRTPERLLFAIPISIITRSTTHRRPAPAVHHLYLPSSVQ